MSLAEGSSHLVICLCLPGWVKHIFWDICNTDFFRIHPSVGANEHFSKLLLVLFTVREDLVVHTMEFRV